MATNLTFNNLFYSTVFPKTVHNIICGPFSICYYHSILIGRQPTTQSKLWLSKYLYHTHYNQNNDYNDQSVRCQHPTLWRLRGWKIRNGTEYEDQAKMATTGKMYHPTLQDATFDWCTDECQFDVDLPKYYKKISPVKVISINTNRVTSCQMGHFFGRQWDT